MSLHSWSLHSCYLFASVIDACQDLSSKVLWLNMTEAGHYQLVVPRDVMRLMKPKFVNAGFVYWLMPHGELWMTVAIRAKRM